MSRVALDVNGFFTHMAGERGLRESDLEAFEPSVKATLNDIASRRAAGGLPFFDLPYDHGTIASIEGLATELRTQADTLVVLGIGGSALGARAALEAIGPAQRSAAGMRVEVVDNVDPASFARLLESIELERTIFNVISKSGQTAETMAQFLVVRERLLRSLGAERYREHVVVTTDPHTGLLRRIVQEEGFRSLSVPEGVGGRFSVLSTVGLLPIAAAGIDIGALCEGARAADARCKRDNVRKNPAAIHAALLVLALRERGASIHVLMPYADSLLRLAEWYAQLWAESLGKRRALDGSVAEVGQTPVRALGATDQHSQVQLYVEGPRDKVVTFVRVESPIADVTIPAGYGDIEGVSYLSGHSLGELLNMEQLATELALAEAGRLTSLIRVQSVDAATLGELFHILEVQTLVAGGLLGIDPLDQPGVEAGKRMTYALAGRSGYAEQAEAVRTRVARKRDDLVID